MGVAVAVDVEDGQDVDVHLVQQAGHGCVTAVGVESLQGATKQHSVILLAVAAVGFSVFFVGAVASLRYLFDEPLAEGGSDPLSGVDAAVHEDGGFGAAALLAELKGQKVDLHSLPPPPLPGGVLTAEICVYTLRRVMVRPSYVCPITCLLSRLVLEAVMVEIQDSI